MNARDLEATAVHTVTLAASAPGDAGTVVCDLRDVFDAPTRVVDISAGQARGHERADGSATVTGERTQRWLRPSPKNASTAAFAQTEMLAVVANVPAPRTNKRGAIVVTLLALAALAATGAVVFLGGAAASFFDRHLPSKTVAVQSVPPTGAVERAKAAAPPMRAKRSAKDLASLEAAAVDALLTGNPTVALARYRELAADANGKKYSRVVQILERTP